MITPRMVSQAPLLVMPLEPFTKNSPVIASTINAPAKTSDIHVHISTGL